MTKANKASNETVTLRETALAFSTQKTNNMIAKIEESFARRDSFEAANGLAITGKRANSYVTERDRMIEAKVAVARLFLALDVEPSTVIERKVSETSMFNAKALKKVTEIARFVCGYGAKLERVMQAFIACTIIATERGAESVNNRLNVQFLHGADLSAFVSDADLIEALDDMRHRAMTSGAETQSSQARNVLDVLRIGQIRSIEKPRDAIALDIDHGFVAQFKSHFMQTA